MGADPRSSRRRVTLSVFVALAAGTASLVACSSESSGATPTLNLYLYPDNSGAVQQAVDDCNAQSNGAYEIKYQKLPRAADGQRSRWSAGSPPRTARMDILGLDVTWAPEFAEAGWILEWTGDNKAAGASRARSPARCDTATYKDKLYAAPYNTNTQLLWYRKDLVPTPPTTWDEMIDMAERPRQAGQAPLHRDPGRPVRGPHGLVQHARWPAPAAASSTATATAPSLGPPAVEAPDDHAATWPRRRRPTRRCRSRWRTRTGWPWSRARRPSSSTTRSSIRR